MVYIRDVGRWLQAHGQRDADVPSDRWKAAVVAAHPYLLSTDETKAFFAAAATLNAVSPWRWQTVAFFTLMHSCGLRTGETRLLRPEHVHLRDRNLDISRHVSVAPAEYWKYGMEWCQRCDMPTSRTRPLEKVTYS